MINNDKIYIINLLSRIARVKFPIKLHNNYGVLASLYIDFQIVISTFMT